MRRPSVPPPTASAAVVHTFLVQFFVALDIKGNLDDAEENASKIRLDGIGLYEIEEKTWKDKFGIQGQTIYHALQTSDYGYDGGYRPTLASVAAMLSLLGLFAGPSSQLWTENKTIRNHTVPIISTCILAGRIFFNLFCKRQSIVDSTRFPERLDIRKRSAHSGPWGLWTSTSWR